MRQFNSHFGMIMSTVIAILLSLVVSVFAALIGGNTITWQSIIRNWGTCYLIITLTGWIFPLTEWSFALCDKLKIKKGTTAHALIENTVASLFFNTFATLILSAVNMFGNPEVEAAVAHGAAPSVAALWWRGVLHDLPICFVFSFIVAWFITKLAVKIAAKSSQVNFEQQLAEHGMTYRNINDAPNDAFGTQEIKS